MKKKSSKQSERGIVTIKMRFRIKEIGNSFVQFYYNEDNGKTSMAMVVKARRVYGHDYTPQRGKRHSDASRSMWPIRVTSS